VHYAQTLDGRIATRTGHSQWISCNATLHLAHQLRADHAAVMVGVGTVCADNPRLTVRLVNGDNPVRVIVDSTLRMPLESHVLTDGAAETLVMTTGRAVEERIVAVERHGARVIIVESDCDGRVDLPALLERLARLGISSLLIEGGAALVTSALAHGVVDRLVVCVAPKIIGAGIEAVGDLGILHMDGALHFARSRFTAVGDDIIFDGEVAHDRIPIQPG
jgi:5-amino-6-(5-phosphoribosylamino)uracil reductase/diaminohydroxyphosphoribosylaminopyrimidine deaminase/5-amino-6-(5-phosphoribosylamino)uracil reductase